VAKKKKKDKNKKKKLDKKEVNQPTISLNMENVEEPLKYITSPYSLASFVRVTTFLLIVLVFERY